MSSQQTLSPTTAGSFDAKAMFLDSSTMGHVRRAAAKPSHARQHSAIHTTALAFGGTCSHVRVVRNHGHFRLSTSDVKKQAAQLTASQYMTAGYFYSVTIYVLSLVDGPGISGCWSRSDAWHGVCLARNIKISVRWIPREFNRSDRGSMRT